MSATHFEEARQKEEVRIAVGSALLTGILDVPTGCGSVVLFAHGSAISRLNPKNRFIAKELKAHGYGSLLLDLLTPEEDLSYRSRFDIDLLTVRLVRALVWLRARPEIQDATVGLFGVSTGAAAALKIAARNTDIGAVVTRAGRPDLAGNELHFVRRPTLLIAGGRDYDVLRLNRQAMNEMTCKKELAVVAQATHQFDEPGAMETVARLTVRWFEHHLKGASYHESRAHVAAVS